MLRFRGSRRSKLGVLHKVIMKAICDNGGDSEKAVWIVLSANLNPQNAIACKYLGYYYLCVNHIGTARCYQISVIIINPNDSDSGEVCAICWTYKGNRSWRLLFAKRLRRSFPRLLDSLQIELHSNCLLFYINFFFLLLQSLGLA